MRLSHKEKEVIIRAFRDTFDKEDHLWLFGSRTDDGKRGGDIDLYVETGNDNVGILVQRHLDFLRKVKGSIGDQKIDLVINQISTHKDLLIYKVAKKTGIPLV